MAIKKTKPDELGELDLEAGEVEPEAPDIEEAIHPEDTVEEFTKIIDDKLEKIKIVITSNQKYLKLLWEKVAELEDNFKLLWQEGK